MIDVPSAFDFTASLAPRRECHERRYHSGRDRLEAIAVCFARAGERSDALRARAEYAANRLRVSWQGAAAVAFWGELDNDLLPALSRLRGALSEAAATARRIAETMRAAEEEAAALFKVKEVENGARPTYFVGGSEPSIPSLSPPPPSNPFLDDEGFFRVSPTPKPDHPLTPEQAGLVQALGVFTLAMDIAATSLSSAGAMAETALIAIDGPIPFGDLAGAAFYAPINAVENQLSILGFASTALSDIISGNSYVEFQGLTRFGIVIGQDTLVSAGGIFLGNYTPNEAFIDTSVNVPLTMYDLAQMSGNPVRPLGHRWELHLGTDGVYFEGYPSPAP